jgi:SAM-dependent methyltransferase
MGKLSLFSRLINRTQRGRKSQFPQEFDVDPELGIRRRRYASYDEYLSHQSAKLGMFSDAIQESDRQYEAIIFERYQSLVPRPGTRILCIAARLGGEVRAFKRLGSLALGIDLEPGVKNQEVLPGDFHAIQFPNEVFDVVFTNALDHVFDLDAVAAEVTRVLVPEGKFVTEFCIAAPGRFESLDTGDYRPLLAVLERRLKVEWVKDIHNKTNYVDWHGVSVCLSKPKSP